MTDEAELVCRFCGTREALHCGTFTPISAACVCTLRPMDDTPGDICGHFVGVAGKPCSECEHDQECHAH